MNTPIAYEYHRPGKGATVYRETLVVERPDVLVLLHEPHEGKTMEIDGKVALAHGAPIVWFVFPDGWADVGRFHDAADQFTGWYTNLGTPVERDGLKWSSTDLFLDLWIPATGKWQWLDEDELREAMAGNVLDQWTVQRVQRERERIEALLKAGEWPPAVCREIDLERVRTEVKD